MRNLDSESLLIEGFFCTQYLLYIILLLDYKDSIFILFTWFNYINDYTVWVKAFIISLLHS